MNAQELKKKWVDFFINHNHYFVKPKSLIPKNDDSLLWINSGVATLKNYFTGKSKPPSPRLVNYQGAIRTNDITNVGITSRHHTFFEMLGNFSIGDYFKKEMIPLSLDFLLNTLKLDKNRLFITYYKDDVDTKELWILAGISVDHIIAGDKTTNFWDLGEGPCGPNTEIFYDRGSKYDPDNRGLELLIKDIENDRYIEVWNIVFSQYNNDGHGNYVPLSQKNIDTGAGLERLLSILEDVPTNYDTGLFLPIIRKIEEISGYSYKINNYFIKKKNQTEINKNMRIISDHIRAVTMMINDGALPSNVGRGYIIRRLIRRAYNAGTQLGIKSEAFLFKLVIIIHSIFPDNKIDVSKISKVILVEEKKFSKTIKSGKKILKNAIFDKIVDEKLVFKLFETYGFPLELTIELLDKENIIVNRKKINSLFEDHQNNSKKMTNKGMSQQIIPLQKINKKITDFVGYETTKTLGKIKYIFDEKTFFKKISNQQIMLISTKTPFYATKGGQSHDLGEIHQGDTVAKIIDVFHDKENNNIHLVDVNGELLLGEAEFIVDTSIRLNLERNHSTTHLLYAALIKVIGVGVFQLGSDNNQNRLKFDFPNDHMLSNSEIRKIEFQVNEWIRQSIPREYILTTYDEAKKMNALGLPKSKLRGNVRVVKFGDFSIELCGGTHISNTKKIEKFFITKVSSKSSGVYRVEAITSNDTIQKYFNHKQKILNEKYNGLIQKIKDIKANAKINEELPIISSREDIEISDLVLTKIQKQYQLIRKQNKNVKNVKIDFLVLKNKEITIFTNLQLNTKNIKQLVIQQANCNKNALVVLGFQQENKIILSLSSKKYNCKKILSYLINVFKGNGGGNRQFAQGSIPSTKEQIIITLENIKLGDVI